MAVPGEGGGDHASRRGTICRNHFWSGGTTHGATMRSGQSRGTSFMGGGTVDSVTVPRPFLSAKGLVPQTNWNNGLRLIKNEWAKEKE